MTRESCSAPGEGLDGTDVGVGGENKLVDSVVVETDEVADCISLAGTDTNVVFAGNGGSEGTGKDDEVRLVAKLVGFPGEGAPVVLARAGGSTETAGDEEVGLVAKLVGSIEIVEGKASVALAAATGCELFVEGNILELVKTSVDCSGVVVGGTVSADMLGCERDVGNVSSGLVVELVGCWMVGDDPLLSAG